MDSGDFSWLFIVPHWLVQVEATITIVLRKIPGARFMVILRILLGVAMLTFGRRLFWLFVGGIGFVFGIHIAAQYFHGQPDWIVIVIALLSGLLGSLIAVFLQNVAVWLAGFAAGGYFVFNFLDVLGWEDDRLAWISFLVGGVIGAVLVVVVFDWALIILSSITGATLITQSIPFGPLVTALSFTVLIILGILIQASLMRREGPSPFPRKPLIRPGGEGQEEVKSFVD